MSKRIYVHTFGCQMNVQDSEKIVAVMERCGYEKVREERQADLIVINTCTIREKAAQKAMSLLGRYRALKKRNPALVVAMGGCLAQQLGPSLLEKVPHLDLVFGTHNIHCLPEMIKGVENGGVRSCETSFHSEVPSLHIYAEPNDGRVTSFVTIMQGCDNYCAFCVVPFLRGPERSRPWRDIVAEVTCLASHGVKEVTLLGQNVNSYGRTLGEEGMTFVGLLEELSKVTGIERIRFTTSHPKDLSDELIAAFGRIAPLCEHIHLPVQSGADKVLMAMNRRYNRAEYLEKVEKLRRVCPDITISSDMIVGFPGETEEDFRLTLDLMEKIRFDNLFSFKYSEREGTAAASLPDKVPEEEKGRRLTLLQELQDRHTWERNRSWIGRVVEVLVEGSSKGNPQEWTGRTRGNKIVNFSGGEGLRGR
ncbi:MAG: tRNA (N6-isopentenyl adenosine(37)-C2)-methylthiotransferase MiaB, partial [Syntrophales bacterium]|nr:tRNA (N6-isopentenyl adenosine(37)-C2)-methylthiotransferase MiaB [Syntrophales bacterium]